MNGLSRTTLAIVALSASAAPVIAQSGRADPAFLTEPPPGAVPASRFVGVDVIGMDHERIGRTEEIVVDLKGRAQAVVIGVGGFLGIGEKRVAVPFDQITWSVGGGGPTAQPRSSTTSANAPSAGAAATAGPETMPGSQVSNDVLNSIDEKRGGEVNDATGSVTAKDQSRGPATVPAGTPGEGAIRAEIRLGKAALQAAPAYKAETVRSR